jgi:hypothetical protein
MDRHRTSAHIRDKGLIDGEPGAGIDHLVSRITIGLLAQTNRRLRTGKYDDSVRGGPDPACFAEVLSDGNPECKNSLRVTIMGIVLVNLPFDLLLDKLGNREVGLSKVTFDDFSPLLFDGPYIGPYLEGILRIQQSNALRKQAHRFLLC